MCLAVIYGVMSAYSGLSAVEIRLDVSLRIQELSPKNTAFWETDRESSCGFE